MALCTSVMSLTSSQSDSEGSDFAPFTLAVPA